MIWLKYVLLSAVTFLCISCKEQTAQIGEQAPDLAAFDLQGNPVQWHHWQGKPVLLSFWSESCGVCVAELKILSQWVKQYPNQIQLVAINIDGEKADTQKFAEKRGLDMPIIKDQLNITAERYQLIGTPTTFFIDLEGKILYKFEGLIPEQDLTKLFKG